MFEYNFFSTIYKTAIIKYNLLYTIHIELYTHVHTSTISTTINNKRVYFFELTLSGIRILWTAWKEKKKIQIIIEWLWNKSTKTISQPKIYNVILIL